MTFLTDAELDALYEASKVDQIPVGSEIRQLISEIRHHRRNPTELQQTFNFRYDADMRAIKMWQAAHPGNDLTWPDRADLVLWLLEQIETTERLDRVDTALARQLGQSIETNARLHEQLAHLRREIEQWANAYPLPAFPEPDMRKAARFLREGGITLDAVTASNIRHVLKRVLEIMNKAQASNPNA